MTRRDNLPTDMMITGWSHSRFGKLADQTLESLIVEVASGAICHAGIDPEDVDAIFLGTFNSGLVPLAFASSLALQVSDALFGVPATRVENACASGSAAVHQAVYTLASGMARNVLVIGAEKMTHAPASAVGAALLGAGYESAGRDSIAGFAGLFAKVATAYEDRYGPVGNVLGTIAAKSHANALANPYAHLRKDLGEQFCQTVSDKNPLVADPLRRTDCSPVSDGAAAIVLSSAPSSSAATPPVRIIGIGQANDFLPEPKRDPLAFQATKHAWSKAMKMAGTTLDDLSFAEVHDCFTIAELNLYEVLGITAPGNGYREDY